MYPVKVVDTMGFLDPRKNPDDTVKAIKTFFRNEVVEGVSLVLFVTSERTVTKGFVDTIERIKKHFKEVSLMSALVITRCETLSDDARERVVKEFETSKDPHLGDIRDFMKKGIYTVGFPDLRMCKEKYRSNFEEEIEKDVKRLHEVVHKSTKMIVTSEMFFDDEFWETVKRSEVSKSECSIM